MLPTSCHIDGMINSSTPWKNGRHFGRRHFHWSGSAMVQLMAWRLFSANPLPEAMLVYYQLDSWEQISVKVESQFYHFHSKNAFEIIVCQIGDHFFLKLTNETLKRLCFALTVILMTISVQNVTTAGLLWFVHTSDLIWSLFLAEEQYTFHAILTMNP